MFNKLVVPLFTPDGEEEEFTGFPDPIPGGIIDSSGDSYWKGDAGGGRRINLDRQDAVTRGYFHQFGAGVIELDTDVFAGGTAGGFGYTGTGNANTYRGEGRGMGQTLFHAGSALTDYIFGFFNDGADTDVMDKTLDDLSLQKRLAHFTIQRGLADNTGYAFYLESARNWELDHVLINGFRDSDGTRKGVNFRITKGCKRISLDHVISWGSADHGFQFSIGQATGVTPIPGNHPDEVNLRHSWSYESHGSGSNWAGIERGHIHDFYHFNDITDGEGNFVGFHSFYAGARTGNECREMRAFDLYLENEWRGYRVADNRNMLTVGVFTKGQAAGAFIGQGKDQPAHAWNVWGMTSIDPGRGAGHPDPGGADDEEDLDDPIGATSAWAFLNASGDDNGYQYLIGGWLLSADFRPRNMGFYIAATTSDIVVAIQNTKVAHGFPCVSRMRFVTGGTAGTNMEGSIQYDDDGRTVMGKTLNRISFHLWSGDNGTGNRVTDAANASSSVTVYQLDGNSLIDLGDLGTEGTLTDAFAVSNGSSTITVTHTSHGLSPGDVVIFTEADTIGGVTVAGDYRVATAPDANTYTMTSPQTATSNASGGGTVTYLYNTDLTSGERTRYRNPSMNDMAYYSVGTGSISVDSGNADVTGNIAGATGTLTNPFSTTASSAIVTVADVAHGRSMGSEVNFSGATAVGGITIDGDYTVTSVIGPDSYTITHSAPATSTAGPGGGTVTFTYNGTLFKDAWDDTGFLTNTKVLIFAADENRTFLGEIATAPTRIAATLTANSRQTYEGGYYFSVEDKVNVGLDVSGDLRDMQIAWDTIAAHGAVKGAFKVHPDALCRRSIPTDIVKIGDGDIDTSGGAVYELGGVPYTFEEMIVRFAYIDIIFAEDIAGDGTNYTTFTVQRVRYNTNADTVAVVDLATINLDNVARKAGKKITITSTTLGSGDNDVFNYGNTRNPTHGIYVDTLRFKYDKAGTGSTLPAHLIKGAVTPWVN